MNLLIADDDMEAMAALRQFLHKIEGLGACQEAGNGAAAVRACASGEIDAVFLNADLPAVDGRSILDLLPPSLPVVILAAKDRPASQYYEHNVADFLLKPLDYARFLKAWQRLNARAAVAKRGDPLSVFVRDGVKIFRIPTDTLQFLKSESNYTQFVCTNRSLLVLASLKHLERNLPPGFVRVHRSYVVNLRHIAHVESGEIFIGDHRVPIGDFYRATLMERLAVIN